MDAVQSARRLTYDQYRIYVVDNGSSDGSEETLRAWDPALTILQAGGNLGWSGGNNVGIRAALEDGCAHVLLLNNDAMLRPEALDILVEATRHFPRAACLGALIVDAHDPDWVEFGGSYVDARTHLPCHIHGRLSELVLPLEPKSMVAVKGCAMLLTAVGLAEVGLLTEDYFLNYDETDWCYRANVAKLENVLVPNAIVEHKGAASFEGAGGPLYRYFITRNRLLFARRHLGLRGQWYAWRGIVWDFRLALRGVPVDQSEGRQRLARMPLLLAVALAVVDYCRGRLGDCPNLIRTLNRRHRWG
jgi:GT2 family glycosyltransferase